MDNNDSITPQDFAKQMGAFPNAPYNPIPVGGYMDEGFNWVLGAESSETKLCACCKDSPYYDADAVAGDDWGLDGLFHCLDCGHAMWYDDMSKVDNDMNDGTGEVCQPCFDKLSDKDRKEHIGDRVMEDYNAESFNADWQTNDKFWKMLHEEHDYLFDENGMVTIPHKQLSEIAKEMGFDTESFGAEFGRPLEDGEEFTPMQVRIGSTWGRTTSWTTSFNLQCMGDEDNLSYLTEVLEDLAKEQVETWNDDDSGTKTTMQIVIGSSSGNSGSWYRAFEVVCISDDIDNLRYLTSDIEDLLVDRVKRWNGDEVSYNAESLSEIEGPTAEASTGGLHSPSSFDITWEDGTGQSSASMPPNEIHFGAEGGYDFQKMTPSPYTPFDQIGNELQQQRIESGPMLEPTNANFSADGATQYRESLRNRDGINRVYCLVCNKLYKSKDGSPIGFTMRNCCGQETETDPNKIDFLVNYKNKDKKNAESRPISEDGELLAIYDDMGEHKGFIEMEDDLEDDSIEIDITDDEMNDIAEVRLDSEVVGNPSPSSPLEEVPATVPSPAEPTNSNFSAEKKTDYITMILGTAALVVGSGMLAKSQGWIGKEAKAADTDDLPSIDPTVNDGLVASPSTGDLLPADYEEMVVESTGYAVPIIPISLDPSFMGSRFHALPTDRLVESNEPGIGAHTDVAMYRDTLYREPEQSMVQAPSLNAEGECNCSIIDKIMAFFKGEDCSCEKEVKESQGVGQTPYFGFGFERKNPQLRVIKETGPIGLDPSTAPYLPLNLSGYTGQSFTPPSIYKDMMGLGEAGASVPFVNPNTATVGANRFGSNPVDSSTLQSIHGNLSSSTNASYTNGSKTMSLAQWSIDFDVSQISDSEAVAVSRSSGIRTMIRRV